MQHCGQQTPFTSHSKCSAPNLITAAAVRRITACWGCPDAGAGGDEVCGGARGRCGPATERPAGRRRRPPTARGGFPVAAAAPNSGGDLRSACCRSPCVVHRAAAARCSRWKYVRHLNCWDSNRFCSLLLLVRATLRGMN